MSKNNNDETTMAQIQQMIANLDSSVTTKTNVIQNTYADALKLATDDISKRNGKLAELAAEIQVRVNNITATLDSANAVATTAKANMDAYIKNA